MGFFSGIAKAVGAIAGIAAAPATGGASLALTAASVAGSTIGAIADANAAAKAQKAQASVVKASANAAISQAQASVKVAELQAEQQEQDRIFQAAQLDKLLAQQEENTGMNTVQTVNDPAYRLQSSALKTNNLIMLAGLGIIAYILVR